MAWLRECVRRRPWVQRKSRSGSRVAGAYGKCWSQKRQVSTCFSLLRAESHGENVENAASQGRAGGTKERTDMGGWRRMKEDEGGWRRMKEDEGGWRKRTGDNDDDDEDDDDEDDEDDAKVDDDDVLLLLVLLVLLVLVLVLLLLLLLSAPGDTDYFPGNPLPKLIILKSLFCTCYIHASVWTQKNNVGSNYFKNIFLWCTNVQQQENNFHGGEFTRTYMYVKPQGKMVLKWL